MLNTIKNSIRRYFSPITDELDWVKSTARETREDLIKTEKEIESLRQQLVEIQDDVVLKLEKECDFLRSDLAAAKTHASVCEKSGIEFMKERDEWKRRAEVLWSVTDELSQEELLALTTGAQDQLEIASDWFEEDKDNDIY